MNTTNPANQFDPRKIQAQRKPANEHQVAGSHYVAPIQHWDFVVANDLNYFEGQITKYVTRARKKNGLQDLQKARHFLDKWMEIYAKQVDAHEQAVSDAEMSFVRRNEGG